MQDCRILIVEDEQVVAMDVELQLAELGYQVTGVAMTGDEALRLVERARPDLVLMDIQLHGAMDGIAVADQIREHWRIPVVFVTAYANHDLVARAKEVEPYGYLTKPFTSKELDASIAIALQQHQLIRELFAEQGWLRTMLGSMNDGVIATDAVGSVKYLNSVAERLVGWTLGEANGLPIESVYSLRGLDDRPIEMCQLRLVLRSGEPIGRQRFILTTRDGRQVVVEDSASPVRDAKGKLVGAVAITFDVTEGQRIERERDHLLRELQRSNNDLEQFAYFLAHDLQGRFGRSRASATCCPGARAHSFHLTIQTC